MEIGSTDNDGVQRGLFLTVVGVGDRAVFADPRATASDVVSDSAKAAAASVVNLGFIVILPR